MIGYDKFYEQIGNDEAIIDLFIELGEISERFKTNRYNNIYYTYAESFILSKKNTCWNKISDFSQDVRKTTKCSFVSTCLLIDPRKDKLHDIIETLYSK